MGGGEEEREETSEMEGKRKEKEEAKVNRKVSATRLSLFRSNKMKELIRFRFLFSNVQIADLEISNASLLAVNRMLEATKAKQG